MLAPLLFAACVKHHTPEVDVVIDQNTAQTDWLTSERPPELSLLLPTQAFVAEVNACLSEPSRVSQITRTQETYERPAGKNGLRTFIREEDGVTFENLDQENWHRCIVPAWLATQGPEAQLDTWESSSLNGGPITIVIHSDMLGKFLQLSPSVSDEEIVQALEPEVHKFHIPEALPGAHGYEEPKGKWMSSTIGEGVRRLSSLHGTFFLKVAALDVVDAKKATNKSMPGVVVSRGFILKKSSGMMLKGVQKSEDLELPFISINFENGASRQGHGAFADGTGVSVYAISCFDSYNTLVSVNIEQPLVNDQFRYLPSFPAWEQAQNSGLTWTDGLQKPVPKNWENHWVIRYGEDTPRRQTSNSNLQVGHYVKGINGSWMTPKAKPYSEAEVRAFCH